MLAEIAAEFQNVSMPLAQRSALKSELHRISKHHVVKIISVILQDALQPSLRQAAIECVEQWLKVGICAQRGLIFMLSILGAWNRVGHVARNAVAGTFRHQR